MRFRVRLGVVLRVRARACLQAPHGSVWGGDKLGLEGHAPIMPTMAHDATIMLLSCSCYTADAVQSSTVNKILFGPPIALHTIMAK